jgi:iron complex outermembrane receptor protein
VITSGGGELLAPETGETFTAGIILTPTFADLNIALDYYEVEINDQITSLSGAQIVGGCYATANFPNDFCSLFDRNPGTDPVAPYALDNILAPTLIVDSSVNFSFERYINVFGSDFVSGIADNDFNGAIGFPTVVGDASIRLDRGDWTYNWFMNFVGSQDDNRYFAADTDAAQAYFGRQGLFKASTEATWFHGASIRWTGDTWTIAGGINNIFGEEPPAVSPTYVGTSAGNVPLNGTSYDLRGRRAFVSISKTF